MTVLRFPRKEPDMSAKSLALAILSTRDRLDAGYITRATWKKHDQHLRTNSRERSHTAHARAGGGHVRPPTGVGVVQEVLEDAIGDEAGPATRETLTVEHRRCDRLGVGRVVDERDTRRRHLIAEAPDRSRRLCHLLASR